MKTVTIEQRDRRIRKAIKFILAEPRRFNMTYGIYPSSIVKRESPGSQLGEPPCGTACCFAGAVYLTGKRITPEKSRYGWLTVYQYVKEFLGMDNQTSTNLFYVTNWPKEFAVLYDNAKTAQERAYVGAARFEHFIATGE